MSVMWRKFPLTEVIMPLQQGIIRCRAGVGEQGKPCGDGKPGGPDVPP